jgi:predicted transcriptional regulator
MEFMLTKKVMDYLLLFLDKKQITKSNQPLDQVRYYFMISYLKNNGLIVQNGFHENQKIWVLSEKGYKIAQLIKKIYEVMSH